MNDTLAGFHSLLARIADAPWWVVFPAAALVSLGALVYALGSRQ